MSSTAAEIIGNLYETVVRWTPSGFTFLGSSKMMPPEDGGLTWHFELFAGHTFPSDAQSHVKTFLCFYEDCPEFEGR